MNAKSKFVELMFNVADKQKRGFLRYREILELVIIMSQGLSFYSDKYQGMIKLTWFCMFKGVVLSC